MSKILVSLSNRLREFVDDLVAEHTIDVVKELVDSCPDFTYAQRVSLLAYVNRSKISFDGLDETDSESEEEEFVGPVYMSNAVPTGVCKPLALKK